MAQVFTSPGDGGSVAQGKQLCLLSLDGGGVRGLSALYILKQLMEFINPEEPPKPCDHFDMIGGTSTGGIIAIMLGRLRMSVDECIEEYKSLSDEVFTRCKHRITWRGDVQGRFDHEALARGTKALLTRKGLDEDALLRDSLGDTACKVFVCATSFETNDLVLLTSYYSKRWSTAMGGLRIWEAVRATSAATTFFDEIKIEDTTFVDGATSANNPVNELWYEALNTWRESPQWRLEDNLKCLVSIGTGESSLQAFGKSLKEIGSSLVKIATDTRRVAETFRRSNDALFRDSRIFRFNVAHGLEDVGLEEASRQGEIKAATTRYMALEDTQDVLTRCSDNLKTREYVLRLQDLISSRISTTLYEYHKSLENAADLEPASYVNTDTFQTIWHRSTSLVWCRTEAGDENAIAAKLVTQISEGGTQRALYFPCAGLTSMLKEDHPLPRLVRERLLADDNQSLLQSVYGQHGMYLAFLQTLLCQALSGWPQKAIATRAGTAAMSLDRLKKLVRALNLDPDAKQLHEEVSGALSAQVVPIIVLIELSDRLGRFEIHELVSDLLKGLNEFPQPLRVVLVGQATETLVKLLENVPYVTKNTEYRECLNSLKFNELDQRKDQVSSATKGTNQWLWTHAEYLAFEQKSSAVLWIEGKPGSGKSVLAKSIQDRLLGLAKQRAYAAEMPFVVGDWFYHKRGGQRFMTHFGLFRSLAFQMLEQAPTLLPHFCTAYRRAPTIPDSETSEKPSSFEWELSLLKEIIHRVTADANVLIIMDALDEAENAEIFDWIEDLTFGRPGVFVKFILLSRPGNEIERRLRNYHRILLERENSADLETVVNAGLNELRTASHSLDFSYCESESAQAGPFSYTPGEFSGVEVPGLKEMTEKEESTLTEIRDFMVQNANSSMLWIKIVLQDLISQFEDPMTKFADLYEILLDFSPELGEYYRQIAADLPRPRRKSQKGLGRKILMLVSAASEIRALTLQELWEILAVPEAHKRPLFATPSCVESNRIPIRSFEEFRRMLYCICGPFLEFLKPQENHNRATQAPHGPMSTIQLMHQTVKDFLANPEASGDLHFSPDDATALLEDTCSRYRILVLHEFQDLCCAEPEVMRSNARLDYSWENEGRDLVMQSLHARSLIEWVDKKILLDFTQIWKRSDDLAFYHQKLFGKQAWISPVQLFALACEHGKSIAVKNLISVADFNAAWWDQTRDVLILVIMQFAAASTQPAFHFTYKAKNAGPSPASTFKPRQVKPVNYTQEIGQGVEPRTATKIARHNDSARATRRSGLSSKLTATKETAKGKSPRTSSAQSERKTSSRRGTDLPTRTDRKAPAGGERGGTRMVRTGTEPNLTSKRRNVSSEETKAGVENVDQMQSPHGHLDQGAKLRNPKPPTASSGTPWVALEWVLTLTHLEIPSAKENQISTVLNGWHDLLGTVIKRQPASTRGQQSSMAGAAVTEQALKDAFAVLIRHCSKLQRNAGILYEATGAREGLGKPGKDALPYRPLKPSRLRMELAA